MEAVLAKKRLSGPGETVRPGPLRIVKRLRWGRWLGMVALAVFVAWIIFQVFTNPGFEWPTVGRYMLNDQIVAGLRMTCELTVLVMGIGIVLGIVLAIMKLSGGPILSRAAGVYIWFFRGTPVLVQLVFWYNLAALFPYLSLGIPFGGPKFVVVKSTVAISSFVAALLGLGLNEGAYMAEIVRGGILSVDPGQTEAAKALGYRPLQIVRVIVLPQAMKAIVPPTGNQVIGMLKYSSLASVVALQELMQSAEDIYSRTFETIPLLIVASLWYLILTTALSIVQHWIEQAYRADRTAAPVVGLASVEVEARG
jgi:polar amino acid transport system permease protein